MQHSQIKWSYLQSFDNALLCLKQMNYQFITGESFMGDKEQKYYQEHADSFKESHRKYMENYVEIKVRMTKEKRDSVKDHASSMKESASAFINRAIDEAIKRDTKNKLKIKDNAAMK